MKKKIKINIMKKYIKIFKVYNLFIPFLKVNKKTNN